MTTDMAPHLMMRGITKFYPDSGVLANNSVDFEVRRGEIHAVIGENGAGKTTLMKIIAGLELPDQGKIFIDGEEVRIRNPLDSNRLGIGMVHQHFRLIPEFTIAENVVLGIEPKKNLVFFNRKEAIRKVGNVIEEYGFEISPRLLVSELSVGQMQMVEIIKVLYRRDELIILDEPTSVLTYQQIKKLFVTIKRLCSLGKTIIIITHKLGEAKEISERVTVMRKGIVVAVRDTETVDEWELSRLMVGKGVTFQFKRDRIPLKKVVIELQEVTLKDKVRDHPTLEKVNIKVHAGEVFGIVGVSGNGLEELEDVVSGLRRVSGGRIYHNGKNITAMNIFQLRKKGLAYVPADRLRRGSNQQASVQENIVIASQSRFLKAFVLSLRKMNEFAGNLIGKYSISCSPQIRIGALSGGNIQKVILARELSFRSDFTIFSEPTWGLDVASSEFVYSQILELRKNKLAILLISSNLDEVMGLADTIAVMYRGRVVGIFKNSDKLSKELIGEYMLGLRDDFNGN